MRRIWVDVLKPTYGVFLGKHAVPLPNYIGSENLQDADHFDLGKNITMAAMVRTVLFEL